MTTTQTNRIAGLRTSAAQKGPCIAASLTTLTLSGEQTIDGIACVEGDRVLYAKTGGSVDNGIYIVSTGEWTRAPDFSRSDDVVEGTAVRVTRGTNSGTWVVSNTTDITFGTTSITFVADTSLLGDALLAADNLSDLENAMEGWQNLQGAEDSIVAAATIDISDPDVATSVYLLVTGNTTISAITMADNDLRLLEFTGTPQITVGGSLVGNNNGQNIQIEAGDCAMVHKKPSGKVQFIHIPARRRANLKQKGTAVASASAIILPQSDYVHVTGTTTIADVDFTDPTDGVWCLVEFDSALTLTHSSNLKCPASADHNVSAGDVVLFIQDSGDSVKVVLLGAAPSATAGVTDEWVPAGAMIPRITNGPQASVVELATNDVMLPALNYDQSTSEGAQFWWVPPKRWNGGTVTARFYWTAASGSGTVTWALAARAFSDDDAMDAAFGTAQSVTDTLITANDMHVTDATAAITVAGTPADLDAVCFQVTRDISDTLSADAKLIGVVLFWTASSLSDA